MTSSNLALWETVERTDPKHVKAITGKAYQGTSPKPHYLIHKATEAFGPCGIGWGFTIVSERIEEGSDGDKLHIARVKVWYEWQGKRGEVEHVGATPFSGKRSSGKSFIDEDAAKKSVTDALVKALSMIGFAGDIFLGRWDDSKYQAELREEFSPSSAPAQAKGPLATPDQIKEIDAEIKRTGRSIPKLLDFYGVKAAKDLTEDQAANALRIMKAQQPQQQAAE